MLRIHEALMCLMRIIYYRLYYNVIPRLCVTIPHKINGIIRTRVVTASLKMKY